MDIIESEPSNYNIIGQITYSVTDALDNVNTSIEGLFSRVFVRYDEYQQELNTYRSKRYQKNYSSEELSTDEEENDDEQNLDTEVHDEQDDNIRQEFDIYWAENGQDIILKLWIEKYKDFVDPAFIENTQDDCVQTRNEDFESNNKGDLVENFVSTEGISENKNCETIDNTAIPESDHKSSVLNKVLTNSTGAFDFHTNYVTNGIKDEIDTESSEQTITSQVIEDPPKESNQISINRESEDFSKVDSLEEPIEGTDDEFNNEWDILWQNHCVEVYNSHFETFKQEWLKNLSETLDAVSTFILCYNSLLLYYFKFYFDD